MVINQPDFSIPSTMR